MFGSQILDVALGMVFLFALLSLIASAVREGGETLLKSRAKELEKGIGELLSDTGGAGARKWLYDHPSVSALFQRTYAQAQTTSWWHVRHGIKRLAAAHQTVTAAAAGPNGMSAA